jgi:hypothetical protein
VRELGRSTATWDTQLTRAAGLHLVSERELRGDGMGHLVSISSSLLAANVWFFRSWRHALRAHIVSEQTGGVNLALGIPFMLADQHVLLPGAPPGWGAKGCHIATVMGPNSGHIYPVCARAWTVQCDVGIKVSHQPNP